MNDLEFCTEMQRLVDGELSHARRSKFLHALPATSKAWRDLALAFVERQVLDEALSARAQTGRESALDSCDAEVASASESPHSDRPNQRPVAARSWKSQATWATAIGACFLIGLALGKWQTQTLPSESTARVASADWATNPQPTPDAAPRSDKPPGMSLAEALSRAAYPISVDLRREMMKNGYLITELDQLSKVELPTGQWVELPVRQVAVTYLGTATYQ